MAAPARMLAPEELEGIPTIELLGELKRRHNVLNRPPTRVAMLGPPCVGKFTQAEQFRRAFGVCRIPASELLAEGASSSGSVDERVVSALTKYLERPQCRRGFVIDGFPTTVSQAERLQAALEKKKVPLQHAIFLDAAEEQLLERCSGRSLHPTSGRRYHDQFKPPIDEGVDDFTGEALTRPPADVEKLKEGIARYREDGGMLREFFRRSGLARDVMATNTADAAASAVVDAVEAAERS